MEDVPFNHVAIQAGGPEGAVGAHSEQTLATAILPLETHPNGLADGAAHALPFRMAARALWRHRDGTTSYTRSVPRHPLLRAELDPRRCPKEWVPGTPGAVL